MTTITIINADTNVEMVYENYDFQEVAHEFNGSENTYWLYDEDGDKIAEYDNGKWYEADGCTILNW